MTEKAPERYGKTRVSKIKAAYDALRSAVRSGDFDAAEAALDRYEQWADYVFDARHATQWRPISEAPKDGTKIVIARAGWSCFPIAVWMEYPGNPVLDDNGKDVWMSGWGHDSAGFTYGHEDYWLGWNDDPIPTHFMPLPEAPNEP